MLQYVRDHGVSEGVSWEHRVLAYAENTSVPNGIKLVHIYAIPMTCEALDGGFASADIA